MLRAGLNVRSLESTVEEPDPTDDKAEPSTPVYTITADLPSGKFIDLYEGDHIHIFYVRPSIERICVYAYPREGAKRLASVDTRIEYPDSPPTKWSYDLYGYIKKVGASLMQTEETNDSYVVDVGDGTVVVDSSLAEYLPSSEVPLAEGDAIYIPTLRLELWEEMPMRV